MESEDELDMHDAHDDDGSVDNEEDFYSGGDDDGAAIDSDDADVGDYEFVDNDSDDSDDMVSYRHQVILYHFPSFCVSPWAFIICSFVNASVSRLLYSTLYQSEFPVPFLFLCFSSPICVLDWDSFCFFLQMHS